MPLKAVNQLRDNINALLRERGTDQKALAFAMRRHPTTVNKFLRGTRELQLADLDAVASFFGLDTYRLFQPGISAVTERRKRERRSGQERRIGHALRQMQQIGAEIELVRGRLLARDMSTDEVRLIEQLRRKPDLALGVAELLKKKQKPQKEKHGAA